MTVFPDGSKERLHGHNYYVGIALGLRDVGFARMIPFGPIKEAAQRLCASWREHTLIARDNPHYQLIRSDEEFEFLLCGKRYVLPREDILVLPIDNVSCEALAEHFCDRLLATLVPVANAGGESAGSAILSPDVVSSVEVRVTESPGQGAVCIRSLGE